MQIRKFNSATFSLLYRSSTSYWRRKKC